MSESLKLPMVNYAIKVLHPFSSQPIISLQIGKSYLSKSCRKNLFGADPVMLLILMFLLIPGVLLLRPQLLQWERECHGASLLRGERGQGYHMYGHCFNRSDCCLGDQLLETKRTSIKPHTVFSFIIRFLSITSLFIEL